MAEIVRCWVCRTAILKDTVCAKCGTDNKGAYNGGWVKTNRSIKIKEKVI